MKLAVHMNEDHNNHNLLLLNLITKRNVLIISMHLQVLLLLLLLVELILELSHQLPFEGFRE